MNQLLGEIVSIKEAEGIAFVRVQGEGFALGVMTLKGGLKVGDRVRASFKESDVMIACKDSPNISARNKFLSPIHSITHNGVLARVKFDFFGCEISSLISYEALLELGVKEGGEFFWFVKSNEIILESLER